MLIKNIGVDYITVETISGEKKQIKRGDTVQVSDTVGEGYMRNYSKIFRRIETKEEKTKNSDAEAMNLSQQLTKALFENAKLKKIIKQKGISDDEAKKLEAEAEKLEAEAAKVSDSTKDTQESETESPEDNELDKPVDDEVQESEADKTETDGKNNEKSTTKTTKGAKKKK